MAVLRLGVLVGLALLAGCGEHEPAGESVDPMRPAAGRSTLQGSDGGRDVHLDCLFYVRVKGRLVDPKTGSGCAGAWLLTLPVKAWADDAETIEQYRYLEALREEARAPYAQRGEPWPARLSSFLAADTADADGTFDVVVNVPWSVSIRGGEPHGPVHPPPRTGVEALLVEVDGKDRVRIDIPKDSGGWTERADDSGEHGDLWATWDLGSVVVPESRLR